MKNWKRMLLSLTISVGLLASADTLWLLHKELPSRLMTKL